MSTQPQVLTTVEEPPLSTGLNRQESSGGKATPKSILKTPPSNQNIEVLNSKNNQAISLSDPSFLLIHNDSVVQHPLTHKDIFGALSNQSSYCAMPQIVSGSAYVSQSQEP